jgi:spermidine synthase
LFAADDLRVGALAARILYDGKSQYGPVIVREQADGVRELLFEHNGAIQSAYRPARPNELVLAYTQTTMSALAVVQRPQRMLIIGLGGGSMAKFLHRRFPQAHIDAVELDPMVVDVARRYFGLVEDERLRVHVGDGRAFIEKSAQRYDIIFLDAFGPDSIPRTLTTREFLEAVRNHLSQDGVVAANIWGPDHNPVYAPMLRTYQVTFDQVALVERVGRSNRIVLAGSEAIKLTKADLVARAAQIQRESDLGFDLAQIISEGFAPLPQETRGARILTFPTRWRRRRGLYEGACKNLRIAREVTGGRLARVPGLATWRVHKSRRSNDLPTCQRQETPPKRGKWQATIGDWEPTATSQSPGGPLTAVPGAWVSSVRYRP